MPNRMLVLLALGTGACERADSVQPPPPARVVIAPAPAPAPPPRPAAMEPHVDHRELPVTPPVPAPPIPAPARRHGGLSPQEWFQALSSAQQGHATAYCKMVAANPCAGMMAMVRGTPPSESVAAFIAKRDQHLASLTTVQQQWVGTYCRTIEEVHGCQTPLVLAFEGQPVEFAPAGAARFAFTPGAPVASEWPTARTPWLALDRDGDGAITSGAELFGDATALPDGRTAATGYAALAALDANHDGVIDRDDPAFASLLVWTDRDGDHRSSPDELQPLASVVIAIPLANHAVPTCTERGACEGERGALRWRDASGEHTGAVVDVYVPHR
jgi:hypothetical protein